MDYVLKEIQTVARQYPDIQRIVLFGERPSPAEIREELTMIFEVASRASLPDAQVAR